MGRISKIRNYTIILQNKLKLVVFSIECTILYVYGINDNNMKIIVIQCISTVHMNKK